MSRVFKFGGASVKDAESVKNVAHILQQFENDELVVVISAMGKTTNALEKILQAYFDGDTACKQLIQDLEDFHSVIIQELFGENSDSISNELNTLFTSLSKKCETKPSDNFNFEYDQIVSLGEAISTKIVHAYLIHIEVKAEWLDARQIIHTNNKWREARINWEETEDSCNKVVKNVFKSGAKIAISQGFIGHTAEGHTTTLGREGSDFSAAIFAYVLDAEDVTIWKDVPGMLNADPKWFDNTVLLEQISSREAIELAYFGASVIHPRTIQPLKRKNIPLHIKSFINPDAQGSVIQSSEEFDANIPSFIFKMDQILVSLTPRDFSFIIEENLEDIFAYLNKKGIRMNIMQNSAVSFSFCVDKERVDVGKLVTHFESEYLVKYNENLELVTIRHYDDVTLERVAVGKNVILEQKSRHTARLVMQNS